MLYSAVIQCDANDATAIAVEKASSFFFSLKLVRMYSSASASAERVRDANGPSFLSAAASVEGFHCQCHSFSE